MLVVRETRVRFRLCPLLLFLLMFLSCSLVSIRAYRFTSSLLFHRNPRATLTMSTASCLSKNTVIILAGATSVGKSAVSLELCKRFDSEIIIADSVQIYRGLDIGANKPTVSEQQLIPHHLIDIAEPHETWTTADFCYRAVAAIDDILARGKVPIVVGGSTMWIQWLVYGIPDAPKASESSIATARELLDPLEEQGDWDQAIAILRSHDAVRSEKVFRNDWYRLRRYLEVALDLSINHRESTEKESHSLSGERTVLLPSDKYDLRCFFLIEDREELYDIIDIRCEQMIRDGLFEETVELVLTDRLGPSHAVSKSIGYRQVIEYLASLPPPPPPPPTVSSVSSVSSSSAPERVNEGEMPDSRRRYDLFLDFLRKFSTATRNYAQRQIKWYRKDPKFLFIKISRNRSELASFALSYQKVTEELLSLLALTAEDFTGLLERQVTRSRYFQKHSQKTQITLPYRCESEEERDVVLSMIRSKKLSVLSLKPDNSPPAIPSSSELWITSDLLTSALKASPLTASTDRKMTALEDDIRYPENKHLRFFASKFQGLTREELSQQPLYYRIIEEETEAMRQRLWSEKRKEMERFREEFLS